MFVLFNLKNILTTSDLSISSPTIRSESLNFHIALFSSSDSSLNFFPTKFIPKFLSSSATACNANSSLTKSSIAPKRCCPSIML
ncbi:hypothetical protein D3C86_1243150 [compost metagenome]